MVIFLQANINLSCGYEPSLHTTPNLNDQTDGDTSHTADDGE